jgi:hypothetical protein
MAKDPEEGNAGKAEGHAEGQEADDRTKNEDA